MFVSTSWTIQCRVRNPWTKGRRQKKKRDYVGKIPKWRTHSPTPQFGKSLLSKRVIRSTRESRVWWKYGSISQYSLNTEWWIQHQTWKWTGDAKLPTSVWTTVRGVGNSISVFEGSTWTSFLFSIILTIIFFSSAKSSYSHPYLPLHNAPAVN